jgi:hypothetical protein
VLTVIAFPSGEDIHSEKLHVCIDCSFEVNEITVGAFQRIKHHVASDPVAKVYAFVEEDAVAAIGGFRIRTSSIYMVQQMRIRIRHLSYHLDFLIIPRFAQDVILGRPGIADCQLRIFDGDELEITLTALHKEMVTKFLLVSKRTRAAFMSARPDQKVEAKLTVGSGLQASWKMICREAIAVDKQKLD